MSRSERYFLTILMGYVALSLMEMCGYLNVTHESLDVAWIASMVLPLVIPAMARALDMDPALWNVVKQLLGMQSPVLQPEPTIERTPAKKARRRKPRKAAK